MAEPKPFTPHIEAFTLVECNLCSSLVPAQEQAQANHLAWHRRIMEAVNALASGSGRDPHANWEERAYAEGEPG